MWRLPFLYRFAGDLCSDPKHHPSAGLDARNHPNGASFCATKHKRRAVTTQQNGKSTSVAALAPSSAAATTTTTSAATTIGADKAAIYGHINVAGSEDGISEGGNVEQGGRVSRRDRNKFCGSLPNHLDVGPEGEMDEQPERAVGEGKF